MMDRTSFVALAAGTLCFTSLVGACGSYSDETPGKAGTGGTTGGTTATAGTGGTGLAAGTGGSTGGTGPMGGTGPAGGTGPMGGTGPAGGTGPMGGTGPAGGTGPGPMGGTGGLAGSTAGTAGAAGGGAADCTTDVPACGGDVTGTWTAASCEMTVSGQIDLGPVGIGCTMAPVTSGKLTVSGTWNGMAGGMYADTTKTTGTVNFEMAAVCLEVSGFMAECDRLSFETIGLLNVACVKNTETMGCTCEATVEQNAGMGHIAHASIDNDSSGTTGTYTAADNTLATVTEDGATVDYSYCVAGNTMTMKVTTVGALTVTGPIVLQKP